MAIGLAVVLMVGSALAIRYNERLALFLLALTGAELPPARIPREDRPEKLEESGERQLLMFLVYRVIVVLVAVGVFALMLGVAIGAGD